MEATEPQMAGQPRQAQDGSERLAARLFQQALGALELYTIYLGDRLGLYRALADGGPASSSELADRTGTTERYGRQGWLPSEGSAPAALLCAHPLNQARAAAVLPACKHLVLAIRFSPA
jgi:hypothetical protein